MRGVSDTCYCKPARQTRCRRATPSRNIARSDSPLLQSKQQCWSAIAAGRFVIARWQIRNCVPSLLSDLIMKGTLLTGTTNETSPPECAGGRGLAVDDRVACLDFIPSREATGG